MWSMFAKKGQIDMTREEIITITKAQGGMYAVTPSVVMLDDQLSISARMLYGVIVWDLQSKRLYLGRPIGRWEHTWGCHRNGSPN